MDDKSAFPYMSTLSDGSIFCDSPGMTFREWQWTIFAAHAPGRLYSDSVQAGRAANSMADRARQEAVWRCIYADAMMAAIAEREQKRD